MNRLKHEPAYSRSVRQLERYQHCHDPHLAGLSRRTNVASVGPYMNSPLTTGKARDDLTVYRPLHQQEAY